MNPMNDNSSSRRDFLRDAAGMTAALSAGSVPVTAQDPQRRATPNSNGRRRPNILVIMTDEDRFPPPYETPTVRAWRESQLQGRNLIRRNSMEFLRHYTGASACVPARTTFFTGHYPALHGVSQTDGAAKTAFDSSMYWLDKNTVPTLGNYFRAAGYRTFYKGKWHVSEVDILIPGSKTPLNTYDADGNPDLQKEQDYLDADRMDAFGFTGYVGPTPHGSDARNSGGVCLTGTGGRDVVYADQVVQLLDELDQDPSQPWLTVCSFVNPHDIVLYGAFSNLGGGYDFTPDASTPEIPPSPTDNETLLDKPTAQTSYRNTYQQAFQPTFSTPNYRRLYYDLMKRVDDQILRVMQKLQSTRMYRDTIVIFTSDHGELLGSHGGLFQKWHCAYEEVTHVPFYVHSPVLFPRSTTTNEITSHVDVMPTILGLAGIDAEAVRQRLAATHTDAVPLVGRNLAPMVRGAEDFDRKGEGIYFMTDDEVTAGLNQQNFTGYTYNSVQQPNHVEMIVVDLPGPQGMRTWKYSRYFDNQQFWSTPCVQDLVYPEIGDPTTACQGVVRTTAVPDQQELYDLTSDPIERINLAHPPNITPAIQQILQTMQALLAQQRQQKRVISQTGLSQGIPGCSV